MRKAHNNFFCLCPKLLRREYNSILNTVNKTTLYGNRCRGISCFKFPQLNKTGYGTGIHARVKAEFDEATEALINDNTIGPNNHSGIFHLPKVSLPDNFRLAAEKILTHENVPQLAEDAQILRNYLWSRRLPIDDERLKNKVASIEEKVHLKNEIMLPFLSKDELVKMEQKRKQEVLRRLKYAVYNWEPIRFCKQKSLEYLIGRSPGEYAVMCRIFNEISKRDSKFHPATLCDFGSGVGTVTWAARQFWSSSLKEHLCADISWEINELAERLLRGGNKNNDHPIPALFFRQHLPESYKIRYDLVVSAFSLMELPSAKDRLAVVDKLWNKTEQYLVIAESGTRAGFMAVMEARDYILGLGMKNKNPRNCFVFSPCPNSSECPRFAFDTIPCNYEVKYRPLYPFHHDACQNDRFCYVVIKRGKPDPNEEAWPRLVQAPLVRTKHVVCRLCTKDAKISEVILTRAKHSKNFRLLARRSDWGDLLPIHLHEILNVTDVTDTEEN